MNYFEKNRSWKDFFISFLLLLAMVVVIFSFIGVSEGAANKYTVNKGPISKNLKIKSVTISNSTVGGIKGVVGKSKSGTTIYLEKGVYKFNNTNIKFNKTLTIVGKGSAKYIVIDARGKGRVFNIQKKGKLKLINVTIKNGIGSTYGGAIYNKGSLSANKCVFTENKAKDSNLSYGGAIYNEGSLRLENSAFKNSTATSGGAIYSDAKHTTYVYKCKFVNTGDREKDAIYNVYDVYGSKIIVKNSYFKYCGLYNLVKNSKISHNKFFYIWDDYQAIANEGDYSIVSYNTIIGIESMESMGLKSGICVFYSKYNKIHHNKIYGNFNDGIYIAGVENKVFKNKLHGKNEGTGICLYSDYNPDSKSYEFSKYNIVTKNQIVQFEYGVYVYKGLKTNKISHNKLFNNRIGLASSYKFKNKSNTLKRNKKNIIKIKG